MQCVKKACAAAAVLVLVILGAVVLPARGQEKAAEKAKKETTVGPFAGTVVDPAGKPVAGATVYLLKRKDEDTHIVRQIIADKQGRFRFDAIKVGDSAEEQTAFAVVARDDQRRIGGQIQHFRREPGASTPDYQIQLLEPKDYRSRLTTTAGQPIARATVRPIGWSQVNNEVGYYRHVSFPVEWEKDYAAETASDGTFTIRGVPATGMISLAIQAEGFGKAWANLNLEKSLTVRLARPGKVHGSVTCEKDPKAAAGIKIRIYVSSDDQMRRGGSQPDSTVYSSHNGVTRPDGSFEFDGLQPGTCRLWPQLPEAAPYYLDGVSPLEVKSGEIATVAIHLKPATKLQGKFVDKQTGAGVPGVLVHVYFQDEKGQSGQNAATTNAQGAFTLYVRPGKGQFAWQTPDQYMTRGVQSVRQVEIKEDTILDPIRLEKARTLEGVVVDTSGKPAADAEIRCTSADRDFYVDPQNCIHTDAAGKFTIKQILPDKTYILRARTARAASDPVNVVPKELKEPVRIVVSEKTAYTLRGTVTDEDGKPISQAQVGLIFEWSWGSGGMSFMGENRKTDEQGRFEFGGLCPGDQYQIRVQAPNCLPWGSPQMKAKPGDAHDFGRIALVAVNGLVEGNVVDSAGKPVADARVFNSGDGLTRLESRSDPAGHFRLQGFRKGPVFVFAEKDGYRFAGVRTTTGAAGVTLAMLKTTEPPAKQTAASASDAQQQRKALQQLLSRLSASRNRQIRQWACQRLLPLDPELAKKRAKQRKISLDAPQDRKSLAKLADEDLDEALSIVAKQGGRAYYELENLAKHFIASDPEKALRCVEEAVVRARSLDQPERAIGLAKMGALAIRLGSKEAGAKLIAEAADMADKWKPSDRSSYMFGSLATAVAAADPDRALRLLDKLSENNRGAYRANIAAAIDDLPKAEAILAKLERWYAQRGRMRLAYRIAPTRPADAVRLVETMPSPYGYGTRDEDQKALAFGYLATVIAPRDRALACSLVDRAFAIYLKPSEDSSGNYGGREGQAAMLAAQAQQIGYPDMTSVVYRALATRPVPNKNDWSPVRVQESSVVMAMFLSLVDPAVARGMLQGLESSSEAIGSGSSGVGQDEWLRAWALADPCHAVELVEKAWTAAKDAQAKQSLEYRMREMVEMLLSAPAKRLKYISRRFHDMMDLDRDEED
jgi:protocatechuate 3,4-dioxygenase beta subunit